MTRSKERSDNTARIRIAGETADVTLRSREASALIPGLVITLLIEKRTTVRGIARVSGKIEDLRIDAGKLGLAQLPLDGWRPREPP